MCPAPLSPHAHSPTSNICHIFWTHCPRGWGCIRLQNGLAYILIRAGRARQNIGGGKWYGYQAEQGRGRPELLAVLQSAGLSGLPGSWRKRERPCSAWGEGVLNRKRRQCKALGRCVGLCEGQSCWWKEERRRGLVGPDARAFARTRPLPAGLEQRRAVTRLFQRLLQAASLRTD